MSDLVSKCGIDCGACPWGPYPRKGMTAEAFERYRNDSKRILGFMPIKTPCPICRTPDVEIPRESKLPNRRCLIRQCVDKSEVTNCAYCSRFPCDTVKATGGAWNREKIEEKLGSPISEEEYHAFVEPFEGIRRLETIRGSLKPEEIVEPAKAQANGTKGAFPEKLQVSKEEKAAFKTVQTLLTALQHSSLDLQDTDTFAQHHRLEINRAHVMRFLWILGNYGSFEGETGEALVVDAGTYEANRGSEKTLAIWSFVEGTVFKALSELGFSCKRVALEGVKEEDLETSTGYLRSKGWVIKMSFGEKEGGTAALKALQTYFRRLDGRYGKKAFQHFHKADLQISTD